jgi:hypothetical protein
VEWQNTDSGSKIGLIRIYSLISKARYQRTANCLIHLADIVAGVEGRRASRSTNTARILACSASHLWKWKTVSEEQENNTQNREMSS